MRVSKTTDVSTDWLAQETTSIGKNTSGYLRRVFILERFTLVLFKRKSYRSRTCEKR